jgi:hypothetical protein
MAGCTLPAVNYVRSMQPTPAEHWYIEQGDRLRRQAWETQAAPVVGEDVNDDEIVAAQLLLGMFA